MITNEAYMQIADQVKEIMVRIGLRYRICDEPSLQFYSAKEHGYPAHIAVYDTTSHTIFLNIDNNEMLESGEGVLEEIIAHELTHAHQWLPTEFVEDVSSKAYWEQRHEQEAYSVGIIWQALHGQARDLIIKDGRTLAECHEKIIAENVTEDLLPYYTNTAYNNWLAANPNV